MSLNLHILFVKEIWASPHGNILLQYMPTEVQCGDEETEEPTSAIRVWSSTPARALPGQMCLIVSSKREEKEEPLHTGRPHQTPNDGCPTNAGSKEDRAMDQFTLFRITLLGQLDAGRGKVTQVKVFFIYFIHQGRQKFDLQEEIFLKCF